MKHASENAISLQNLHLQEGDTDLSAITLAVPRGSRFALLGAPQSGKTLLVRALAALVKPQTGSGHLVNFPLGDPRLFDSGAAAVLHQSANWPGRLTAADVIQLYMWRIREKMPFNLIGDLMEQAGLPEWRHTPIERLSPVERQLVGLIVLGIQQPDLLFLDDPAYGLDATGRAAVFALLDQISTGKTVFFTTSNRGDVENVATHAALLHRGRILAQGPTDTLLAHPDAAIYEVVLQGDTQIIHDHVQPMAWVRDLTVTHDGDCTIWTIALVGSEASTHLLRAILADQHLKIMRFTPLRPPIDGFLAALSV